MDRLPTRGELRRLIGLRYAVILVIVICVLFMRFLFAEPIPWWATAGSVAALVFVNGGLQMYLRRHVAISEGALFLNFVLELAALTALVYSAGGPTSPLVTLYLLPVTMAANLLARRHTWAVAGFAALSYSLLLVTGFQNTEHIHDPDVQSRQFADHLIGMWLIFVVSAALVAHYVSSMAEAVRARDVQLARAREEALRNERIVALGTLGAGAAHELGTPLATMSILAEDMASRFAHHPELAADVAVLQGEIAQCKSILTALTKAVGSERGEGGGGDSAAAFLTRTVERWQLLRPTVPAAVNWNGAPPPKLLADQTLEQALINLLNNAADASPQGFEVEGHVSADAVVIDILDRGPGLNEDVRTRAGELYFSTKAPDNGMGIGLFLANATIERFGGTVSLFNRAGGGCRTRVTLPPVERT